MFDDLFKDGVDVKRILKLDCDIMSVTMGLNDDVKHKTEQCLLDKVKEIMSDYSKDEIAFLLASLNASVMDGSIRDAIKTGRLIMLKIEK